MRNTHTLINSAEKARDFLIQSQKSDGIWSDFEFHVGGSTSWITALCLLNMSFLPRFLYTPELTNAFKAASDYLLKVQNQCGGWGYNERVPEDGDSTVHALLALSRISDADLLEGVTRILSYEADYGSFRTFSDRTEGNSWGLVHHEVGAIMNIAINDIKRAERFTDYANEELKKFRRLSSFWWGSHSYPAYAYSWMLDHFNLKASLTQECKTLLIAQCSIDTNLSIALSGIVAGYWNEKKIEDFCLNKICDSQDVSGSWEPSPCLRNVDPACTEQWRQFRTVSGVLFPDCNRIVTTSFALRFISNILNAHSLDSI